MRKPGLLFTFFLCVAAILLLVGCNILDNLVKDGGGSAPLSQLLNRFQGEKGNNDATAVITTPQQGESTIKLFFADKSGTQLIEVYRTIPKTLSLAKETVCQWLMGPTGGQGDVYAVVNPATSLRSINIKNGIAIVDLSKEFLEPYSNIAPEIALYGLVNTLTQFPTVELVKIRIEGQDINMYRGLDLSNLRFRHDLIGFSAGPLPQGASMGDNEEPLTQDVLIAGLGKETGAESEEKYEEEPKDGSGAREVISPSTMNLFTH
ncbi:MAG TPA: GerMN domain-containing protein [Peptococcaceae bacterium]|nr:GerMN domain-containing protein [Peptococcaceae bacterium]